MCLGTRLGLRHSLTCFNSNVRQHWILTWILSLTTKQMNYDISQCVTVSSLSLIEHLEWSTCWVAYSKDVTSFKGVICCQYRLIYSNCIISVDKERLLHIPIQSQPQVVFTITIRWTSIIAILRALIPSQDMKCWWLCVWKLWLSLGYKPQLLDPSTACEVQTGKEMILSIVLAAIWNWWSIEMHSFAYKFRKWQRYERCFCICSTIIIIVTSLFMIIRRYAYLILQLKGVWRWRSPRTASSNFQWLPTAAVDGQGILNATSGGLSLPGMMVSHTKSVLGAYLQ